MMNRPIAVAVDAAKPIRGVLLGFTSFALFSFSDASVKLVQGRVPPTESAFFGAAFGLAVMCLAPGQGGRWRDLFATTSQPLWLLRFFALPVSIGGSVKRNSRAALWAARLLALGFAGWRTA